MIADTGTEDVIPLPNVPGKILAKVIEYCKYHVDANKKVDDKPSKSEDDVKQWDNEFVKVDQATLFDLILVGGDTVGIYALAGHVMTRALVSTGSKLPQHQGPAGPHMPDGRQHDQR